MSSVGIRISQGGIPIQTAADYQMVMDERWPVVEMAFMGLCTVTATVANGATARLVLCTHNLDYLPIFTADTISVTGVPSSVTATVLGSTKEIVYRVANFTGSSINVVASFFVCVVNRDCSKEFAAPIAITTSTQTSSPSDYGLRVVSNDRPEAIDENNKSNFNFNTNAKTFTVQMHGIRTANAGTSFQMILTHRLGYPPSFLLTAIETWDAALHTRNARDLLGVSKSNSITMTLRGAQAALNGDFMFLILKDPVDLAR